MNADIIMEDFVSGAQERVISVVVHRDGSWYTNSTGGDALVSVFNHVVECMTASTDGAATADVDEKLDAEYEVRLLVDSSRK